MGDGFPFDPQVIIILVVLLFGAVRWAVDQFRKTRGGGDDQAEDQPQPPLSEFEDLYEEARREILERQSEAERQAEAPPEPTFRPSFEPEVVVPPPLPPQMPAPVASAPVPSPVPRFTTPAAPTRPQLSAAEQAALQRVQASGLQTTRRAERPRARSRVRELLSSPASTRDAIVLREILGAPKGME